MLTLQSSFSGGIFLLGISLVLSGCVREVRPDGGRGLLPVGAAAPNIRGTTSEGTPIELTATRGHPSVVYFYPKDATPGCTKEACAFRDVYKKYDARHVTIFGVSRDSEESHRKFRLEHKLPFPLVADEDGTAARAYGVSSTLGMTSRVTFLVGADGKIAHVWGDVDPGVHADQVLAVVDGLAGSGSPEASP